MRAFPALRREMATAWSCERPEDFSSRMFEEIVFLDDPVLRGIRPPIDYVHLESWASFADFHHS